MSEQEKNEPKEAIENCSHDCSSCSASCASRDPKSFLEPLNAHSKIGKVIAIMSGKGGVGKSSVTAATAAAVAKLGYKVGILDGDITGPSIPQAFGVHTRAAGNDRGLIPEYSDGGVSMMSLNLLLEAETDPVVWRGSIMTGVIKQFWTDVVWGELDYLFVDMPPGTGDIPMTVFQSLPVDGIIVVTSPQDLVSMIVEKALNMAKLMEKPVYGIVENYSYFICPDCGKAHHIFGASRLDDIAAQHNIPVLARIPMDSHIASAMDNGLVETMEQNYLTPVAEHLVKLG